MENYSIETTQNVLIDFKPAGLGDRILSYLIDLGVKLGLVVIVIVLFIFFSENLNKSDRIVILYITGIILVTYDLYMEIFFHGQSIGKKIKKLRVVKIDGTEPSISSYLLRWCLGIIDVLISFGVGAMISIITTKYHQRIGDLAANTTVIKNRELISLSNIVFDIPKEYITVFPEVSRLDDKDIDLIKEIIKTANKKNAPDSIDYILLKAKNKLQTKMDISSDLSPFDFLTTLVKDFHNENAQMY